MNSPPKGWVFLLIPFSASIEAARPLNSEALDQITAAGVNSQLNWVQREGEVVAASNATAEIDLLSNITLKGSVQNELKALNVVNAAASDSAQLLNIATIDDNITYAEQTNELEQDSRFVGQLGKTISGGPTINYSYGRGYSRILNSSFSEGVIQIDNSFTSVLETEIYQASVAKWDPLTDYTFSLGKWDAGSVNLGTLGIDLIFDSGIAGSYGLALTAGPVKLFGPALDLGSIQFLKEDIIFHPGSFTLPAVDFGIATWEFCVAECTSGSTNIGKIGGTKISPFSDVIFADASPFKDWDLNLNSGIAAIGEGEVTVTGPGVYVDLSLTLDMNSVFGSITDFIDDAISSGPISDLFSDVIGVTPSDSFPGLSLPVINFTERITILEAAGSTHTIDDNGLCISFVGAPGCEIEQIITITTTQEHDGTLTETTERNSDRQMEFYEFEETQIFNPGNFEDVQADIIVTTDSSLTHTKNNNTLLTDGAQRNLTAMNAVNASNAIIGNSSNLMNTQAILSNQPQVFRQTNLFIQKK